jgi:hypothetical protein
MGARANRALDGFGARPADGDRRWREGAFGLYAELSSVLLSWSPWMASRPSTRSAPSSGVVADGPDIPIAATPAMLAEALVHARAVPATSRETVGAFDVSSELPADHQRTIVPAGGQSG